MRHTGVGLHFILAQHRCAAKCRLAQTLAITGSAQRNLSCHRNASIRKIVLATGREMLEQPSRLGFATFHDGSASAKPDVGWRFAPACCAAQSVRQARRRSAVQGSSPARYPVTSGVPNEFFGTWHRAGGAVQFGHQCPLPAQTHPKERQLRSSSLERLMASIF